ncbi:MAG: DUF2807 domain-containing protein [Bacteroidota bacterium]|nr:DUF2807 domain-containing protein [Bacteroidota bacterium]
MKTICLSICFIVLLSSCEWISSHRVKGDGHIVSENRTVSSAQKIRLAGSYEVELVQGDVTSLKIEADENLLPLIETENEDGWLDIRSRKYTILAATQPIKVYITTNKLEAVKIAGSGNINGKSKFTGGDQLVASIAGSGNINLSVNTPKVKGDIAGSGNINIDGETRDEEIHIAGMGDYRAENLKAENAEVHIAGSGNVKVYAENKLDIHIAGSGDVYYKGNASVEQHIAGSGKIAKME